MSKLLKRHLSRGTSITFVVETMRLYAAKNKSFQTFLRDTTQRQIIIEVILLKLLLLICVQPTQVIKVRHNKVKLIA